MTMDPNANIEEQLSLVRRIIAGDAVDIGRLAGLVQSLDEWLTKGGAPPARWSPTVYVCAWCSHPISHGICVACARDLEGGK